MVRCETAVKTIHCRVLRSAPLAGSSDVFAAGVLRGYRVSEASESMAVSRMETERPTYSMHGGSVRMVYGDEPAGQSLDCFA